MQKHTKKFFRKKKITWINETFKIPVTLKSKNPKGYPITVGIQSRTTIGKKPYLRQIFHRKQSPKYWRWANRMLKKKYRRYLQNQSVGEIRITFKRRNTFLNLVSPQTSKSPRKILGVLSAGMLGYTGRRKATPFVREQVGEQLGSFAVASNRKICSLIFAHKAGRIYKLVLRGLARTSLMVKTIKVWHVHPHGYVRAKKKRRV
jgi:ribosomal protein S11